MNKVYNTVWNESTGMWVVTSELTRKGGRRPRQIRRTALAGLIAGLFLPSAPALAVDYNNETLGSGATSSSMSLNAGDTATDTTINSGGNQYVSSGGSATDTTLNSGGYQYIDDSASVTSTTINSGGYQSVSSGGSATDTIINLYLLNISEPKRLGIISYAVFRLKKKNLTCLTDHLTIRPR
ncbi:ESPR-type extended signal peptide-containing protein, partial [Escherichia coli]|uniref:ESPR-type extended signal peptide-containing protein n=1 Tax=Escherichia coli TaxID=562 RepID=UPI001495114B